MLYHLAVRAYNTAGTGPSSAAVNVTTKKPRECLQGWGLLPGRVSASAPLSHFQALLSLKELSDFSLLGFCEEDLATAFYVL